METLSGLLLFSSGVALTVALFSGMLALSRRHFWLATPAIYALLAAFTSYCVLFSANTNLISSALTATVIIGCWIVFDICNGGVAHSKPVLERKRHFSQQAHQKLVATTCLLAAFFILFQTSTYDAHHLYLAGLALGQFSGLLIAIWALILRPHKVATLYVAIFKVFLTATLALLVFRAVMEAADATTISDALLLCVAVDALILQLALFAQTNIELSHISEDSQQILRKEQQVAAIAPLLNRNRHNLRAPISNIVGLSELTLDSPLNQEQRDHLLQIQSAARNALMQIGQIFSFQNQNSNSRYANETGIEEVFSLPDVITECIQYFDSNSRAAKRDIVVDLPGTIPSEWKGDHSKVRQLLLHMLEYSLNTKSTQPIYLSGTLIDVGTLSFTISSSMENADNQRAEQDNTNDQAQLNIAESLAKYMGGSFHWKTHKLQLSLHAEFKLKESKAIEHAHLSLSILRGKRILFVDDNPVASSILKKYGEQFEMQAFTTSNADETLALLSHQKNIEQPIHYVFIDYLLVGCDGLELARKIKVESPDFNASTLFLVSNAADSIDRIKARNRGIKQILEQPLLPHTLGAVLAEEALGEKILQTELGVGSNYRNA